MAKLFVIFVNHEFDIIEENIKSAVLHMMDLQEMDCDNVTCFVLESKEVFKLWEAANNAEELSQSGKPVGRKWAKRIEEYYEGAVTVSIAGIKSLTRQALED